MRRMPRPAVRRSPYRVQVLDRALAALEILANREGECSLVDLCAEMKLHKSTVHRLAMVLEQHRLVDKNPHTGRDRLGPNLFQFRPQAISPPHLPPPPPPH